MPTATASPHTSTGRTIGLCVAGWLVGYLISLASSILFFALGHINPEQPASNTVVTITAIYGVVFAVVASVVGASFSRLHALGIAFTIGLVAIWSWYSTPRAEHWSHLIAILLMAPAAQFGSLARRLPD
jgi:hypothetical protein